MPRSSKPRRPRPSLDVAQVLAWADEHHARTGRWPLLTGGPVAGTLSETWAKIDRALRSGYRGLAGGSSLARLLEENRGVRNRLNLPLLTEGQILAWADEHHARTGDWPDQFSGPVAAAPWETWSGVNHAIRLGYRALPGGSSLADLLQRERGVRNIQDLPPLSYGQILAWADADHARTGRWPTRTDGAVPEAPCETWQGIDLALVRGGRHLPGGSSLARLLQAERGTRNPRGLPRLGREQILARADAHFARTGRWPTSRSGPIPEAPGETWMAVQSALANGYRGLPGGSSLARFLRASGRGRRAA
jgi:hypothetical protein